MISMTKISMYTEFAASNGNVKSIHLSTDIHYLYILFIGILMHENESSLTERNRKNNFFNNPNVILIQLKHYE